MSFKSGGVNVTGETFSGIHASAVLLLLFCVSFLFSSFTSAAADDGLFFLAVFFGVNAAFLLAGFWWLLVTEICFQSVSDWLNVVLS